MINYVASLFVASGFFLWYDFKNKLHYLLSCIGLLEISNFVDIKFSGEDDVDSIARSLLKVANAIRNNFILLVILSVSYTAYVLSYTSGLDLLYLFAPVFPLLITFSGNAAFTRKYKKFNSYLNKHRFNKRG